MDRNNPASTVDQTPAIVNHTIIIEGIEDGKLIMTNKGNVDAKPGHTITWIIKTSEVDAITHIYPKEKNPNVFNPDPAPIGGNSKNWKGTINPEIKVYTEEYYNIDYTTRGGSGSHDPKISVNA